MKSYLMNACRHKLAAHSSTQHSATYNQSLIDKLDSFLEKKDACDDHVLKAIKGRRGKNSSSRSESNHSSVLVKFNDREKIENARREEPITLVKCLFMREDKLDSKCNDCPCNQSIKLKNELLILELDDGSMDQCLIGAV